MIKEAAHSKKILIVGAFSTRQYTYASSFHRVIAEMGYDVQTFDYRQNTTPIEYHIQANAASKSPKSIIPLKKHCCPEDFYNEEDLLHFLSSSRRRGSIVYTLLINTKIMFLKNNLIQRLRKLLTNQVKKLDPRLRENDKKESPILFSNFFPGQQCSKKGIRANNQLNSHKGGNDICAGNNVHVKSVVSKIIGKFKAWNWQKLFPIKCLNIFLSNHRLKKTVLTFKPDLIFIIKGESIKAKTLDWIKSTSPETILINFYPDNPFVFWNGNSNQEILLSLPLYDYFLSWSQMLMPALESAGCKNVLYFPFAYDKTIFNNLPITSHHKNYSCDVSFVGTWDAEREWWLTKLITARPNLNLGIWGNNWHENLSHHSPLQNHLRGTAIYPPESVALFRNSVINLNFIRKQNITSHNMRTFEIPASGGFMMAQRTDEQAKFFFKEDESIACFGTLDELIKKIDFYLKQPSIRKAVMHNSTTIAQHYTLQNYIKNLFKKIIWREDEHSNETKDCDTYYSQLL